MLHSVQCFYCLLLNQHEPATRASKHLVTLVTLERRLFAIGLFPFLSFLLLEPFFFPTGFSSSFSSTHEQHHAFNILELAASFPSVVGTQNKSEG
jgi:hypothetical protein